MNQAKDKIAELEIRLSQHNKVPRAGISFAKGSQEGVSESSENKQLKICRGLKMAAYPLLKTAFLIALFLYVLLEIVP